jgi:hypothetical protein
VQNGIAEGERIVVGAISTPIPGMRLRLEDDQDATIEHTGGPAGT